MSDTLPEPDGMSLVMPFVVVASQGGPYDDTAFAAGWEAGAIDTAAAMAAQIRADSISWTARTDLLPQLDLIAMRHGYRMTAKPRGAQWHVVTFDRVIELEEFAPDAEEES